MAEPRRDPTEQERALTAVVLGALLGIVLVALSRRRG
jgi:hypothetical protein